MSRPPAWDVIEAALAGEQPPWLRRFSASLGRGAHRHGMFRPGDRVLIGVSGGKDSLALALGLALRRRSLPFKLELHALTIDWEPFPASASGLEALREYFSLLAIPYEIARADPLRLAPARDFSCYSCARARKRFIFERARELDCGTVAFGHHLDDAAETLLMNLAFHGRFEALAPVREFGEPSQTRAAPHPLGGAPIPLSGEGVLRVVRPLIEVREGVIKTLVDRLELPVLAIDCPYKETNLRRKLKPVVAELAKMDKLVREKLYRSTLGRCVGGEEGPPDGE